MSLLSFIYGKWNRFEAQLLPKVLDLSKCSVQQENLLSDGRSEAVHRINTENGLSLLVVPTQSRTLRYKVISSLLGDGSVYKSGKYIPALDSEGRPCRVRSVLASSLEEVGLVAEACCDLPLPPTAPRMAKSATGHVAGMTSMGTKDYDARFKEWDFFKQFTKLPPPPKQGLDGLGPSLN